MRIKRERHLNQVQRLSEEANPSVCRLEPTDNELVNHARGPGRPRGELVFRNHTVHALGNDDDVVMRDGLFFNNSEVKKLPTTQALR